MLRIHCVLELCYLTQSKEEKVEDIPTICEFRDVFLKSYRDHPTKRLIFKIELLPGAPPISKALYRMNLTELRKLKIQLDRLLQKGFTGPCVPPWGAQFYL